MSKGVKINKLNRLINLSSQFIKPRLFNKHNCLIQRKYFKTYTSNISLTKLNMAKLNNYDNFVSTFNSKLNIPLLHQDVEIWNLVDAEKTRQTEGLELIASENFTSQSVMECLGSVLTNKYAEGYPGSRYYGGCEIVDKVEQLCQNRALNLFELTKLNKTQPKDEQWGVNVQPYSGSIANMAVYNGLLNPHDRIMGLGLPSGGHLTHGFYTQKKKVSATSIFYESFPYGVNEDGYIDYDKLEEIALIYKPRLIICGYSAYSRDLDYERFRSIADKCGSYLMCDMAHFSGFVATKMLKSPFPYCDIVTTTTHKTLRGPRAGMIFYRLKYKQMIDQSLFPGLQGGPHMNQIAGVATQLLTVNTPEFCDYIKQVVANSRVLARELSDKSYKIQTGGTDNHIILLNLRPLGITGSKVEEICNRINITINKNSVPGDKSAMSPGGIRIGSSPLTSRNMVETDFKIIAGFLDDAINLAVWAEDKCGSKKLADFKKYIDNDEECKSKLESLRLEVTKFAKSFPLYD